MTCPSPEPYAIGRKRRDGIHGPICQLRMTTRAAYDAGSQRLTHGMCAPGACSNCFLEKATMHRAVLRMVMASAAEKASRRNGALILLPSNFGSPVHRLVEASASSLIDLGPITMPEGSLTAWTTSSSASATRPLAGGSYRAYALFDS